mmetsp:Transcript_117311/g.262086  ORF Transcript_117311/g.262086 Transcript_117311/m.262086 type:complete len:331 (-) Transcript_117311:27-1019(-)
MRRDCTGKHLTSQVQPPHPVSLVPLALPRPLLCVYVDADAVLLSAKPLPAIGPPVRPSELPLPRLPVLQEAAFVEATIRPAHNTSAAHLVVAPLPLVDTSVGEGVSAFAFHSIIHKLPSEGGAVTGGKEAEAMFLPATVVALEVRPVCPRLVALAALHVLVPLAIIGRAIHVNELASAVRLVIHPLALVDIPIGMSEPSGALGPVLSELPLVSAAIRPGHDAEAMAMFTEPLPRVGDATLQLHRLALLKLGVIFRHHFRHLEPEVLALRLKRSVLGPPVVHVASAALQVRQHAARRVHEPTCAEPPQRDGIVDGARGPRRHAVGHPPTEP